MGIEEGGRLYCCSHSSFPFRPITQHDVVDSCSSLWELVEAELDDGEEEDKMVP